jgi:hypothetical protein
MKMNIIRDKSGNVVGTYAAGEAQTTSGTVEISPELGDGQMIETIEILTHETFDVDALHKKLGKRTK